MSIKAFRERRARKRQKQKAKQLLNTTLFYDSQHDSPSGAFVLDCRPRLTEEQFNLLTNYPFRWRGEIWVALANGEHHSQRVVVNRPVLLNQLEDTILNLRLEQILEHGDQIQFRGWYMINYLL